MIDPPQLISDYFNGTLNAENEAALRAHILASPENAAAFMQAAMLHNNLRDYFHAAAANKSHDAPELENLPVLPAYIDESALVPLSADFILLPKKSPPQQLSSQRYRWKIPAALSALAASIAIIITLSLWYRWLNTPIATLTRTVNADWISAPLTPGQPISRRLLELRSGFAQLSFASGAIVLVQGPASFRMESPSSMHLYAGRVTTRIPQPAIGFTVTIPSGEIVDLGTEVGIDVTPDSSHIEIFKGKAGIRLAQTPATAPLDRIMTAGIAIDVNATTQSIEPAPLEPLVFTRVGDLDQNAPLASVAADTFMARLLDEPDLLAFYACDGRDEVSDHLTNRATATAGKFDAAFLRTSWTQGPTPNTRALVFNGINSRALLNINTPAPALTLTAWVNTAHFDRPYAALLMSDGATRVDSCHFQLSNVNNRPNVLFSTPAPDLPIRWFNYHFPAADLHTNLNTWRFITIIYDPAAQKVSCWLDGEFLNARPLVSPTPITIGSAQLGNWNGNDDQSSRAFTGAISQLSIWKRPLTPEEIDAIYTAAKTNINTVIKSVKFSRNPKEEPS